MGRSWRGDQRDKPPGPPPPNPFKKDEPSMDESPFDHPEVMDGYPFSEGEKRVIREMKSPPNAGYRSYDEQMEFYRHHLGLAQQHAQKASESLYGEDRLKRNFLHRLRILRAQNALMSTYVRELRRKK